jgi:hypothetical protein
MKFNQITTLIMAMAAGITCAANASDVAVHSFSLTVTAAHPTVKAGEEVRIHVVLTNITDHGIWVPPATLDPKCDYRIQVQDKSGLATSEPGCDGSHILGLSPMRPGESLEGDISLTDIYHIDSIGKDLVNASNTFDFNSPGEHVVQLLRWDGDGAKKEFVPSNKITITVLPDNTAPTAPVTHSFSIAISTPAESIKLGHGVRIHVVETNVSDAEAAVPATSDRTRAETHYAIAVSGPKGLLVQQGGFYEPSVISLNPGEQFEEDGVLQGPSFDFGSPGEYTIQFFQRDGNGPNPWSVKSNKMTITVTE